MAKSLRSKRKRKMRGIKRERYGKRELVILKGVVAKAEEQKDVEMKDMYTVKTATELKKEKDPSQKISAKTLKNEHGNYPVWMNQRKVRKHQKELKKEVTKTKLKNKGKKKKT